MKTAEFYCGTKSFSKVAAKRGYSIFTNDSDSQHNPDICCNILEINEIPSLIDFAWFSPPCGGFSVAVIGRNWDKETGQPKTASARLGITLLDHTIYLISKALKKNPNMIWFIENPRGMMRKVIDELFKKYRVYDYKRYTVTYCQYGDVRMKATDMWSNLKSWTPRPICKNGDSCHVSAPRGSRTGTQGLKGSIERSRIPSQLFEEIFDSIKIKEMIQ